MYYLPGHGRGVFPLLSMLTHGCVSNCRYINTGGHLSSVSCTAKSCYILCSGDGRTMECRATTAIPSGQQLLGHYVSPMDSTRKRREALQ